MTSTRFFGMSVRVFGLTAFAATAQAASLEVAFQATIASEQHPIYAGEARYYHVSVNSANPGVGSYAATIVGTNDPAPSFVRNFTEDVISYKWIGGTNNDISGVAVSGGEAARITYATSDTTFDGFGQQQLKLWTTTDPGADIATGGADPYNATADTGGGGYRYIGGAIGTVDISGLVTGSVYVFYGAFNATPTVSAVMRDTDGPAPDITITNAHLNGDAANRTEYYVAELQFVNDAGYDEIEYTHLANGVDYAGNGRGLGTLLTGSSTLPVPFTIIAFSYDPATSMVSLTWPSSPGENFALKYSRDMTIPANANTAWGADLNDSIMADAGETTTYAFKLSDFGLAGETNLFFRVEK
jgi:hypothetical protein